MKPILTSKAQLNGVVPFKAGMRVAETMRIRGGGDSASSNETDPYWLPSPGGADAPLQSSSFTIPNAFSMGEEVEVGSFKQSIEHVVKEVLEQIDSIIEYGIPLSEELKKFLNEEIAKKLKGEEGGSFSPSIERIKQHLKEKSEIAQAKHSGFDERNSSLIKFVTASILPKKGETDSQQNDAYIEKFKDTADSDQGVMRLKTAIKQSFQASLLEGIEDKRSQIVRFLEGLESLGDELLEIYNSRFFKITEVVQKRLERVPLLATDITKACNDLIPSEQFLTSSFRDVIRQHSGNASTAKAPESLSKFSQDMKGKLIAVNEAAATTYLNFAKPLKAAEINRSKLLGLKKDLQTDFQIIKGYLSSSIAILDEFIKLKKSLEVLGGPVANLGNLPHQVSQEISFSHDIESNLESDIAKMKKETEEFKKGLDDRNVNFDVEFVALKAQIDLIQEDLDSGEALTDDSTQPLSQKLDQLIELYKQTKESLDAVFTKKASDLAKLELQANGEQSL